MVSGSDSCPTTTWRGANTVPLASAVNLMLWAGPTSQGGPGFAAWDLFRAQDADKVGQSELATRVRTPLKS